LAAVDVVVVNAMVYHLAPFDSHKQVDICFVEMDDSEQVDFVVVRFFQDHYVDDGLPAFVGVAGTERVVDHVHLGLDE
jgi:hypothetical protein